MTRSHDSSVANRTSATRRPEFTPAENLIRDGELRAEIRQCFGLLHLRGRYVADYGLPRVKTTEEYACFVNSHADDSGPPNVVSLKLGQ